MKRWQRIWLLFLITFGLIHLLRDILQDLGIKVLISQIFVKQTSNLTATKILWSIFNTYVIASVEILLAVIALKRNKFGKLGFITIAIALIVLLAWMYYWFVL